MKINDVVTFNFCDVRDRLCTAIYNAANSCGWEAAKRGKGAFMSSGTSQSITPALYYTTSTQGDGAPYDPANSVDELISQDSIEHCKACSSPNLSKHIISRYVAQRY